MAGEPTEILRAFEISPFLSFFFRNNFSCRDDLAKSRSIAAELQQRCLELDHDIAGLDERISAVIPSYASLSERIDKVIGGIRAELADLCSSPSLSSGISGFSLCFFSLLDIVGAHGLGSPTRRSIVGI